jgi:hypothetical protein
MSVSADELQFCFVVEWFDTQACVTRAYNLFYFAIDKTIEMVEIKSRRLFLKRCSYPAITLNDLYIGATVTVYARQLRVKSYGDDFTRERLTKTQGRTLCIVKPDAYEQTGKVLDTIVKNGFSVARLRMVRLSPQQAAQVGCSITLSMLILITRVCYQTLTLVFRHCFCSSVLRRRAVDRPRRALVVELGDGGGSHRRRRRRRVERHCRHR